MIEWYYLIIVSALLNAASLIVEKSLLRTEHALRFSMLLATIIGILSMLLIPFISQSVSPFALLLTMIYSALLAVSYWMTARLFRHGSLSTGSPLYNVLPIIVIVVGSFFFLGENIGAEKYLAILIILLATFIMVGQSNKKRDTQQRRYYDLTIAVVALLIGITNILLKYALFQINPITFILLTSIFTPFLVALLIVRRSTEYREKMVSDLRHFIKPLLLMGALVLGYRIFLYSAVAIAPISIAAPLSSAIIVVATVLPSGLLFGEHHIPRKVLFSMVMLIAAYFLVA